MKRLTAILLLFCLSASCFTTILWYCMSRNQMRNEIRWRLIRETPAEDLVVIRMARSDTATVLSWFDPHEFRFAGHMYDIARREYRGDSVIYHCLNDHAETALKKRVCLLMANSPGTDPFQRRQHNRILEFFKMSYSIPCQICTGQTPPILTAPPAGYREELNPVALPPPPSPPPEKG